MDIEFDVAVSFAGEDRGYVEDISLKLKERGVKVFYDKLNQADLWGKDLYQHLAEVYKTKAKYCIIFISKHYIEKHWSKHELRHAQSRSFEQDTEYILPIRLDETNIPGIPSTIGYLDARTISRNKIIELILQKVSSNNSKEESLIYWKIKSVLNAYDPVYLLGEALAPSDEYDPETEEILEVLPYMHSSNDLADRIKEIFIQMFDVQIANDFTSYDLLANEIWYLKQEPQNS